MFFCQNFYNQWHFFSQILHTHAWSVENHLLLSTQLTTAWHEVDFYEKAQNPFCLENCKQKVGAQTWGIKGFIPPKHESDKSPQLLR